MPPTPADFTTKQDKEDVNTKWHLNMPDKDFREPLPPMDPEEKRDKRERLFEKFKSTTITVTSPKTNKTVQVDVLVPIHVLEGKLQEGRTVPKMHVRFHGGGFVSQPDGTLLRRY